ncbi:ABC transporter ATP-binding protein [Aureliella helgolandensis]|uniref:Putative ABC transporter ATP-binding protein YbhF n=1 Tax=Aureliella helgolandensis TaxID=2527968 RepID=A0A518GA68_9BACT|nr:ABC transporter ATP-binding protein [Aureliella helgolandensis]QDV25470.1 putative ABC transporter ATP-binding protein YbhF [Aureliella helgolandensis]
MSSSSEPVVCTRNLCKSYGSFTALKDLTIHVDRGQILGFIGPNGAGKTTTIKILVGLSRATSGSATIAGVDCSENAAQIKHLVGYMPDRFGSYDNMRVREYLDFFGAIYRIPTSRRRKRIEEVLEITNATYMQDKFVESLSHGMQQRVGIARTLLHDPTVMILDEPANGLDPSARIEMREILLRLAGEGKTLIVTSHILPELARICDTVAIVTGGSLRAFGTLDEVMRTLCPVRSYEIQLLTEQDLDLAIAGLAKALPECRPNVSRPERMLRFPIAETEERLSQLLSQLVSEGVKMVQFREVVGDLEDAFLSVAAGKSEAVDSPHSPAAESTAEVTS